MLEWGGGEPITLLAQLDPNLEQEGVKKAIAE